MIETFPGLKFCGEELRTEFCDHTKTDPRVRSLAFELAFIANQHDFNLEVTQISRTLESQIKIYGSDRPSGHREQPARAIDFSVKGLTKEAIAMLIAHFEAYLKQGQYFSLLCHDKGFGLHLHLQVPHANYNKLPTFKG
jgi:hypothetical protein